MRFWTLLTISVCAACLVSFCSPPHTPADLKSSVSIIHQYADSFKGVRMSEARGKLSDGKLSEEAWSERGFGGKQLVATYPHHEVRVFFVEDKAITTSIQILSK